MGGHCAWDSKTVHTRILACRPLVSRSLCLSCARIAGRVSNSKTATRGIVVRKKSSPSHHGSCVSRSTSATTRSNAIAPCRFSFTNWRRLPREALGRGKSSRIGSMRPAMPWRPQVHRAQGCQEGAHLVSSEYCLLLFDAHAPKTPETSTNRKVPYSHACRCMPGRGAEPRTLLSTRTPPNPASIAT